MIASGYLTGTQTISTFNLTVTTDDDVIDIEDYLRDHLAEVLIAVGWGADLDSVTLVVVSTTSIQACEGGTTWVLVITLTVTG